MSRHVPAVSINGLGVVSTTEALRASYVDVRAFHENANTKNLSHLRFCVFLPDDDNARKSA
jgi:hypothetical protein